MVAEETVWPTSPKYELSGTSTENVWQHFNDAVISIASSLREFMKAKRRQIYELLQSMSTTRMQKVEK